MTASRDATLRALLAGIEEPLIKIGKGVFVLVVLRSSKGPRLA
jgi:hypothetical protein